MKGKKLNLLNDKGLTLIELMVSMAILSIVIIIICSFLAFGSKSYSNASDEVQMQISTQTIMNQLEDMIIESHWVTLQDKSSHEEALIIYAQNDVNIVIYNSTDKKLYLIEKNTFQLSDLPSITYNEEENLMSNDVLDIKPISDEVKMKNEKAVQLEVDFKVNSKEVAEKRTIHFRNQLIKPADIP